MKKIVFALFWLLLFKLNALQAQATLENKDDFFDTYKNKEDFSYSKINFYTSFGVALKPNGNMFDVYEPYHYSGYSFGSFGGPPEMHSKSKPLHLGAEYAINDKIKVGLWMLPKTHKCFEGGTGQSDWSAILFIPVPVIYTGKTIKEELFSKAYLLNAGYKIVPYKQIYLLGLELSAGVGIFANTFDAQTTLGAYDTLHLYDSGTGSYITNYYSDQKDYRERKTCYGATLNVDLNIYIGKYISLFFQGYAGTGTGIHISEKSLTTMRETAYVPAHTEMLKGAGGSIGLAVHFLHKPNHEPEVKLIR